jgi:hypothetical protein
MIVGHFIESVPGADGTTRNLLTDLVLFSQASSLALTGVVLKIVLPRGTGRGWHDSGCGGTWVPPGGSYGPTGPLDADPLPQAAKARRADMK